VKKTITKPDGTTEVVEGSPEEIAEYEKALREQINEVPKKDKKKLLLESEAAREFIEALTKKPKETVFVPQYIPSPAIAHDPSCEIVSAGRGWWSVTPPRCTCGLITYAERPLYSTATNTIKLIAPRTSDEIAPNLDGATTFTLSTRSQARA
jgi:hypothetical protein